MGLISLFGQCLDRPDLVGVMAPRTIKTLSAQKLVWPSLVLRRKGGRGGEEGGREEREGRELWGPKGGGPNLEKVGLEGWASEDGASQGGGPKFRVSRHNCLSFFPSLGGLLMDFWWCFEAPGPSNVHVWSSWGVKPWPKSEILGGPVEGSWGGKGGLGEGSTPE